MTLQLCNNKVTFTRFQITSNIAKEPILIRIFKLLSKQICNINQYLSSFL